MNTDPHTIAPPHEGMDRTHKKQLQSARIPVLLKARVRGSVSSWDGAIVWESVFICGVLIF